MSERLKIIASLVPKNSVVGDVGSDHAYLALDLIEAGIAKHVIASDINQGPLNNAKKNVAKSKLNGKIELRLGSGLMPFSLNEVDVFVIAGMGGALISDIIASDYLKAKNAKFLILQPMQQQEQLRRYLIANQFSITEEITAIEGDKYYQIFVCKATDTIDEFDDMQYKFGINYIDDKNYQRYLAFELQRQLKIIGNLNPENHNKEYTMIQQKIAYIRSKMWKYL